MPIKENAGIVQKNSLLASEHETNRTNGFKTTEAKKSV